MHAGAWRQLAGVPPGLAILVLPGMALPQPVHDMMQAAASHLAGA